MVGKRKRPGGPGGADKSERGGERGVDTDNWMAEKGREGAS